MCTPVTRVLGVFRNCNQCERGEEEAQKQSKSHQSSILVYKDHKGAEIVHTHTHTQRIVRYWVHLKDTI